jgi:hypothetical protein
MQLITQLRRQRDAINFGKVPLHSDLPQLQASDNAQLLGNGRGWRKAGAAVKGVVQKLFKRGELHSKNRGGQ